MKKITEAIKAMFLIGRAMDRANKAGLHGDERLDAVLAEVETLPEHD